MIKKRVLFLSNFCLANSGFGKYQKNILSRLYNSEKYEICELAAGVSNGDPYCQKVPWRVIGVLPGTEEEKYRFSSADDNLKRAYQYGLFRFDQAVLDFKPDVVIAHEDIWCWSGWVKQTKTWGKFIPVAFHPFDAEPMSEEFVEFLKDFKYIYTYGEWSKQIGVKAGLNQTEVATLGIDTNVFKPLDQSYVKLLRAKWGIKDTDYVVLMVARNQVRKKFDALFESLNDLKTHDPELYKNIKIIPFSHYADGAGFFFPKFWKSRGIDFSKILTPYFCENCKGYFVSHTYDGEDKQCLLCKTPKSSHTPSVASGLTDEQLNEIYNISDLFTLPTSNEGFGLPISEAQGAGKIVLTTDYSTCKELAENSGAGFTIPCVLYVEHGTLFYKAHVTSYNIAKQLSKIYAIKPQTRKELEQKARQYAVNCHSYDKLAKQWEERIDSMVPLVNVDWNIQEKVKNPNPNAQIPNTQNALEWICSLYKNILDTDVVAETNGELLKNQGVQYWLQELTQNRRSQQEIEGYFRNIATEDSKKRVVNIRDFLDPLDSKRLLYVMPQSAGDNFLSTAVVASLKEKYPEHSIYVSSRGEFQDVWKNNPHIKRWLPFDEAMVTYGWGIDRFEKGVFDIVFTPTQMTQCNTGPNWHHNAKTKSFLL